MPPESSAQFTAHAPHHEPVPSTQRCRSSRARLAQREAERWTPAWASAPWPRWCAPTLPQDFTPPVTATWAFGRELF